ncbi:MAG: hypothetical protein P8R54_14665 [Myxococcota bacterium]|nr:hypothetical protein [Myxococcota bacterium]
MYADLHRHLDGSLRMQTVAALAAERGLTVPPDLAFNDGMGLSEALSRFAFTLSLLDTPQAVARVAAEICDDATAEGVSTLEIRFAPQLHTGAPMAEILDAALYGIAGRAGLILCGLYGEAPSQLEALVRLGADRAGVVGLDLAGGPSPEHDFTMSSYAPAFTLAAEVGLGRTVHAGEGRPPQEIRVAVEQLSAQRIGHGTTILDDPSVVSLLIERGVTIEACVTSNLHTGIISTRSAHPLPRWLDAGLTVCACTDNTLLSAVDSPEEHRRIRQLPGMSDARLAAIIAAGHAAAFPLRLS